MDTVIAPLSELGTIAQALTGKTMGEFGTDFLQGVASSTAHSMVQALPPRALSAPPASFVCDTTSLEPERVFASGIHNMGSRKRTLARSPSGPLKRARGGATGELLLMRNAALSRIKQTCENCSSTQTNMAKRWEASCKARHVAPAVAPPELTRWGSTFNETCARLKTAVEQEVGTWTLSSAPARLPRQWQSTSDQSRSVCSNSRSQSKPRREESKPSAAGCSRLGAMACCPPMNGWLCASYDSCLTMDSLWQNMARS